MYSTAQFQMQVFLQQSSTAWDSIRPTGSRQLLDVDPSEAALFGLQRRFQRDGRCEGHRRQLALRLSEYHHGLVTRFPAHL